jgi:hypothetical protein
MTLYEAAVMAMAEFRRCGFTENAPGPATRLTVKVQSPRAGRFLLHHTSRVNNLDGSNINGANGIRICALKLKASDLLGSPLGGERPELRGK